ncbi:MAG: hypothetical protein OEX08_00455 [Candidatus Nomurabacteria bacterium]|nr:hypothetical protein [Candidatus Nomurabacteria bacterium]
MYEYKIDINDNLGVLINISTNILFGTFKTITKGCGLIIEMLQNKDIDISQGLDLFHDVINLSIPETDNSDELDTMDSKMLDLNFFMAQAVASKNPNKLLFYVCSRCHAHGYIFVPFKKSHAMFNITSKSEANYVACILFDKKIIDKKKKELLLKLIKESKLSTFTIYNDSTN